MQAERLSNWELDEQQDDLEFDEMLTCTSIRSDADVGEFPSSSSGVPVGPVTDGPLPGPHPTPKPRSVGRELAADELECEARRPDTPRTPPLHSRAYQTELLSRTDQQKCIFIAKVTDAYRHAILHKQKLLSVFYHYINRILEYEGTAATTPREARYFMELEATLTQVGHKELRHFYPQCVSEAAAPEVALSLLRCEWSALLGRASGFLQSIPSQPAERAGASPPVPFAALDPFTTTPDAASPIPQRDVVAGLSFQPTRVSDSLEEQTLQRQQLWVAGMMMQAMELFERYYPLQAAVREAELWVQWYYTSYPAWDAARRARDAQHEMEQQRENVAACAPVESEETELGSSWETPGHSEAVTPLGATESPTAATTPVKGNFTAEEEVEPELCGLLDSVTDNTSSASSGELEAERDTVAEETRRHSPQRPRRGPPQSSVELLPSLSAAERGRAPAFAPPSATAVVEEDVEGAPSLSTVLHQLDVVPFPRMSMKWDVNTFPVERQSVEVLRLQRKLALMYSANEELKKSKLQQPNAAMRVSTGAE